MSNSSAPKSRLAHIDLLECIAIYFVLAYHGTMYSWDILADGSAQTYGAYFFRTILSACVPLFFFANGYLLFFKPFDLGRHTRRTLRLMILTVVWAVLLLLILQPVKGQYLTAEQLGVMFWDLEIGWINQLWFMGALVGIYLFYPLIRTAYDSNRCVFYWFVAVAAIMTFGNNLIGAVLTAVRTKITGNAEVYDNFNFFFVFNPFFYNFGYAFVYFCMGGILLPLEEKIRAVPAAKRNAAAAVGILLSCFLLGFLGVSYSILDREMWEVVWNGYDTVFTLCNVVCLYLLCLNWRKDVWIVRTVSCSTMGIYFTHDVINQILRSGYLDLSGLYSLPGSLLYALILLVLSLAVCLILRKIPLLSKLVGG